MSRDAHMAKVLIVEDDRELCKFLQDSLTQDRYQVELAFDGDSGRACLRNYVYDVIVLDLALPGMDGLDILRQFRSRGGKTPVLILTGKTAVPEKEEGLDAGADDYLTKPFHFREFAARLRALLRRPGEVVESTLKSGNLTLNPSTHLVTVDNRPISVSPKEFQLLELFMRYPNKVFANEDLLNRVWTSDADVGPETVRSHIKRLRRKLEIDEASMQVVNVYGVGYKFTDADSDEESLKLSSAESEATP